MDTSDIKKELWHSLDMAVLRRDLILFVLAALIWIALTGVFMGGFWEPEYGVMAAVISSIIILPALVYSLCIASKIYRHADRYRLYRVKLSQFHHQAWSRGAMYFTVVLEDEDGRFVVNTRPIFACWGIAGPLLEEYNGKTVTVAYNEDTEAVVVLG